MAQHLNNDCQNFASGKNELYLAWLGIQYIRNKEDKQASINNVDNKRYADVKWTTVKDLLSNHKVFDITRG